MLIFVSDIHLTDALHGSSVSKLDAFQRFWVRIQAARGQRPAKLAFVGDLFDLVRSPSWLSTPYRPYQDLAGEGVAVIERITEGILERERPFFDAIRAKVESGELEIYYALGNHDRLLSIAPRARRAIWKAMTGRDEDVEFPTELVFPQHGVLAYHGHLGDPINDSPDGSGTVGDALASELIVRFPRDVQALIGKREVALEDIDDVRPIYAVPAWVREIGIRQRELLRPIGKVWQDLVSDFLDNDFVRHWMRQQHKFLGLDTGKKLKLMLELSTGKLMAHTHDHRLTKLYKLFQHSFDGRMANRAIEQLEQRDGLRYVVNGHSHFASMLPLGNLEGKPAVYFNTGTWRTLHQIGHGIGGRPSFLAFDAMSYLVFFPSGDPMGRDFEWWNGALVTTPSVNALVEGAEPLSSQGAGASR
jgi:UDP-2,3-diacylglucosamine pyrophosphatase LpxH